MTFMLLDLFCGAGGAAMGYHQALEEFGIEHEIVGIDINPMPRYPFTFIQADALEYGAVHGAEFDFIHASPPCQAYMDTNKGGAKPSDHPRLIEPTRELFLKTGKKFIIENVHLAPLRANLMLCGTMFGLRVIRHRYFECSDPPMLTPLCNHWGSVASGDFIGVYAFGGRGHRHGKGMRDGPPEPANITASEAMGIDWMREKELFEAIPPAYTRWIMRQFLERLILEPTMTLQYNGDARSAVTSPGGGYGNGAGPEARPSTNGGLDERQTETMPFLRGRISIFRDRRNECSGHRDKNHALLLLR